MTTVPLPLHPLGHSSVQVSALSLGTVFVSGLFAPIATDDARATIDTALAAGMTYVDTAPYYGLGRAEEVLSEVLRERPRDTFTLSTKVGRRLRPLRPGEDSDPEGSVDAPSRRFYWDFTSDGVRASLLESLERLGLERVDVLYLHDPDTDPEHEDLVYSAAYPALARLRDEGVVGAIGAGMNQSAMLTRFVERLDLDVVLCAGRYTLLDPTALADLLPACERRGTSVVIGGVYNSGLLADPRPGAWFNYAPAPEPLVERATRMAQICADAGVPLRAAALQYAAAHPAIASVLVGCRTPAEVTDNREMWEYPIPAELWDRLEVPGPHPG